MSFIVHFLHVAKDIAAKGAELTNVSVNSLHDSHLFSFTVDSFLPVVYLV